MTPLTLALMIDSECKQAVHQDRGRDIGDVLMRAIDTAGRGWSDERKADLYATLSDNDIAFALLDNSDLRVLEIGNVCATAMAINKRRFAQYE